VSLFLEEKMNNQQLVRGQRTPSALSPQEREQLAFLRLRQGLLMTNRFIDDALECVDKRLNESLLQESGSSFVLTGIKDDEHYLTETRFT